MENVFWKLCFLLWVSAFDSFLLKPRAVLFPSVFYTLFCVLRNVTLTYQLVRWVGWAWGSLNGVKITKHLLYYTGVCLFLLYKGASPQLKLFRIWIKAAQLCIPLFLHVQTSYILSCLPLSSFLLFFAKSFMPSLFIYCHYFLCPLHFAAPSSPSPFVPVTFFFVNLSVHMVVKKLFFVFVLFLREMFWG